MIRNNKNFVVKKSFFVTDNFMCQLGWIKRWSIQLVEIISGYVCDGVSRVTGTWVGGLDKDHPHQCGSASTNLLLAQLEQKVEKFSLLELELGYPSSPLEDRGPGFWAFGFQKSCHFLPITLSVLKSSASKSYTIASPDLNFRIRMNHKTGFPDLPVCRRHNLIYFGLYNQVSQLLY